MFIYRKLELKTLICRKSNSHFPNHLRFLQGRKKETIVCSMPRGFIAAKNFLKLKMDSIIYKLFWLSIRECHKSKNRVLIINK